jgi:hypothetical protein
MADAVPDENGDNVVPLRPAKAAKSSEEKWGANVMALGFSVIPSLIFRAQRRLLLSPSPADAVEHIKRYFDVVRRRPRP